jgi:hypothetical protein
MAWRVTYYELLGIAADERDPAVIEDAAVRRSSRVRVHQLTRAGECARLLGVIAEALLILLDPVRRAAYDRGLRAWPRRPAPGRKVRRTGCAEKAPPCDVRLVFRE